MRGLFQKDLKTTHSQIALVQKTLTDLEYDTQDADGKFGDHTLAAVKAFPQAKHLTVDGYFGKNSLAALELDIGEHLDPTPGGCIAAVHGDDSSTDSDANTDGDMDNTALATKVYDQQAALAYAAKWYVYDSKGNVVSSKNLYNLQGDVIALIDSSGNRVVEYRYDAWGRILGKTGTMADSLGTINPFRYRGYVYDGETGLYYLRSQYYKPNWARFLNADANIGHSQGVNSHNIMAYCCNKPVNNFDPDGKWLFFASMCLILGGVLYADHKIATMRGLTDEEKLVARAHPIEAAIAKNASEVAGKLTDDYWGEDATNYDATAANAFKHAVWNALMTRDLGYSMARNFATAHEAPYYGDMTPYKMRYDESIVMTIHDGTIMDLINNERGRKVGQSVPFYYSNDQVAQAVISDMQAHPEEYCILVNNYCASPIR